MQVPLGCLSRLQILDFLQHFVVLRESAEFLLVPDLRAVNVYVEHAAGAFNQFRRNVQCFLQRFRQTGGCGQVVSFATVFDSDIHGSSLHPLETATSRRLKPAARRLGQIHGHQEFGVSSYLLQLRSEQFDGLDDVHIR